jgi:hypothetical protein
MGKEIADDRNNGGNIRKGKKRVIQRNLQILLNHELKIWVD